MRATIVLLSLACLLGACSLAPKQDKVALEIPAAWKQLPENERGTWKRAEPAEAAPRGQWWTVFKDPVLDDLETQALGGNQSLKAAAARVKQARSLVGVAEASRLPRLDAGVGVTRERPSAVSLGQPDGTAVAPVNIWRGLLTASYEVDLFGRVSDSVKATRSDQEAVEALLRSVQLALQADVAQTYLALRAADADLALLRDTLAARERAAALATRRLQLGDVARTEHARAANEVALAQGDLAVTQRQRAQLEDTLALLLGRPANALRLAPSPGPSAPPTIPPGLPSSLLERRPDVAAAQRAMAAANARIGVARSAFFPVLNLTTQGGFESGALSNLFKWSGRTWALGPLFGTLASVPLFDGSRNQANLDRALAVLEESVASYRQQVLVSFSEVEGALLSLRSLDEQARAAQESVRASAELQRLAEVRYRAGAIAQLELIDAQRGLLQARRLENQVAGNRAAATVALIRALGGGWQTP